MSCDEKPSIKFNPVKAEPHQLACAASKRPSLTHSAIMHRSNYCFVLHWALSTLRWNWSVWFWFQPPVPERDGGSHLSEPLLILSAGEFVFALRWLHLQSGRAQLKVFLASLWFGKAQELTLVTGCCHVMLKENRSALTESGLPTENSVCCVSATLSGDRAVTLLAGPVSPYEYFRPKKARICTVVWECRRICKMHI